MATQREIAERVGVSAMTVSLALRDSPRVSAATRRRVRAAARALGYVPNPLVSSLMRARARRRSADSRTTVAYLAPRPWITPPSGGHPFHWELLEGAREALAEQGFGLDPLATETYAFPEEESRLADVLASRGITGLLLGPAVTPTQLDISMDGLAVICIGRSLNQTRWNRVAADQILDMTMALHELRALGYRRVGFFDGEEHDRRNEHRWTAGFLLDQHRSWTGIPPCLVGRGDSFTPEALLAYVETHDLDAVVSARNPVAAWVVEANRHRRVPLGFASLELTDAPEELAGIDPNFREVGRVAGQRLADEVLANRTGPPAVRRTVAIAGTWRPGTSAPTVRGAT